MPTLSRTAKADHGSKYSAFDAELMRVCFPQNDAYLRDFFDIMQDGYGSSATTPSILRGKFQMYAYNNRASWCSKLPYDVINMPYNDFVHKILNNLTHEKLFQLYAMWFENEFPKAGQLLLVNIEMIGTPKDLMNRLRKSKKNSFLALSHQNGKYRRMNSFIHQDLTLAEWERRVAGSVYEKELVMLFKICDSSNLKYDFEYDSDSSSSSSHDPKVADAVERCEKYFANYAKEASIPNTPQSKSSQVIDNEINHLSQRIEDLDSQKDDNLDESINRKIVKATKKILATQVIFHEKQEAKIDELTKMVESLHSLVVSQSETIKRQEESIKNLLELSITKNAQKPVKQHNTKPYYKSKPFTRPNQTPPFPPAASASATPATPATASSATASSASATPKRSENWNDLMEEAEASKKHVESFLKDTPMMDESMLDLFISRRSN